MYLTLSLFHSLSLTITCVISLSHVFFEIFLQFFFIVLCKIAIGTSLNRASWRCHLPMAIFFFAFNSSSFSSVCPLMVVFYSQYAVWRVDRLLQCDKNAHRMFIPWDSPFWRRIKIWNDRWWQQLMRHIFTYFFLIRFCWIRMKIRREKKIFFFSRNRKNGKRAEEQIRGRKMRIFRRPYRMYITHNGYMNVSQ